MDTSSAAVDARLTAFRARCHECGLALTPQRLAIYQVLASDASHPSAEDIFKRIKPALLSLSLGTVYRTLELFETHGLVSRVHVGGNQARFDANLDNHHHLVCVRCRRVIDYPEPETPLPVSAPLPEGFRVLAARVHLLGLCAACQDKA